jgi:CheY-like chemotaxis protein
VLEAGGGEQALALAATHPYPIHLVVTDVVMPGMGGPDLVARLHERWPDVRALYMTGYADDAVLRAGGHDGRVGLLRKPFDPPALGAKVREILDAPAR